MTISTVWVVVVAVVLVNLILFAALWTRIGVTLKGIELRVAQLERDRQDTMKQLERDRSDTRSEIKELTQELHNLVVELARQSGTSESP